MRTDFADAYRRNPAAERAERLIRTCVHCGICTAACPTYRLLGDELDSPRGRIYLMRTLLESEQAPTAKLVSHLDRCLGCLSCVSACPSGVEYDQLIDIARELTANARCRSPAQRIFRAGLARFLCNRRFMRIAIGLGALTGRILGEGAVGWFGRRLGALIRQAVQIDQRRRRSAPGKSTRRRGKPSNGGKRVALFRGCVQAVATPQTNRAVANLLRESAWDVVTIKGEGCCGALAHHLGDTHRAMRQASANLRCWHRACENEGVSAIVVTATGCQTMIANYARLQWEREADRQRASSMAGRAVDLSELLLTSSAISPLRSKVDWHASLRAARRQSNAASPRVAYHAPCSLNHGLKRGDGPRQLLEAAGYRVMLPADANLCCGSAGTYSILQPALATRLGEDKIRALTTSEPDCIATANVGCQLHLAQFTQVPVVHYAELLDRNENLSGIGNSSPSRRHGGAGR